MPVIPVQRAQCFAGLQPEGRAPGVAACSDQLHGAAACCAGLQHAVQLPSTCCMAMPLLPCHSALCIILHRASRAVPCSCPCQGCILPAVPHCAAPF